MVDSINDIARQARQGSVSAIIQVLNDNLADSGVRTRAVFEQGVLQLLCEAPKPEQLEQTVLVPNIRQILESLQPRQIRRVKINSRIVREQQLLWLEEIQRDGINQLLWSEEIVLNRPNPIRRFFRDLGERQPLDPKAGFPKKSPSRFIREKRLFWRGLIGGASLSIFLLLVGWTVYNWLERSNSQVATETPSEAVDENNAADNAADSEANSEANPSLIQVAPGTSGTSDPFADAVRLAEAAVQAGQQAETPAEWQALAEQWQQASDLMSQISPDDPRYEVAQDRVAVYRQNSESARLQAESN
ncbi:hypothetical protein C7B76_16890 [filamentous cyanobacterium CCP2]|nr:hypothetical protein C7B76_16890 [filamentous cyanobacterium CCP2]